MSVNLHTHQLVPAGAAATGGQPPSIELDLTLKSEQSVTALAAPRLKVMTPSTANAASTKTFKPLSGINEDLERTRTDEKSSDPVSSTSKPQLPISEKAKYWSKDVEQKMDQWIKRWHRVNPQHADETSPPLLWPEATVALFWENAAPLANKRLTESEIFEAWLSEFGGSDPERLENLNNCFQQCKNKPELYLDQHKLPDTLKIHPGRKPAASKAAPKPAPANPNRNEAPPAKNRSCCCDSKGVAILITLIAFKLLID